MHFLAISHGTGCKKQFPLQKLFVQNDKHRGIKIPEQFAECSECIDHKVAEIGPGLNPPLNFWLVGVDDGKVPPSCGTGRRGDLQAVVDRGWTPHDGQTLYSARDHKSSQEVVAPMRLSFSTKISDKPQPLVNLAFSRRVGIVYSSCWIEEECMTELAREEKKIILKLSYN